MPWVRWPSLGQAHAHDGVARLQEAEEDGLVRLRAGARLHVGVLGAEQLLHPIERQPLDGVDLLAPAVVALARVPLGVLVRELGPLGRHHRRRGVVFGRDELDVLFLALVLALDGRPDLGVDAGDGRAGAVEADDRRSRHGGWLLGRSAEDPGPDAYAPVLQRVRDPRCPGERLNRRPGNCPETRPRSPVVHHLGPGPPDPIASRAEGEA